MDALKVSAPVYVHKVVRGSEIMDSNADGSMVWTRKEVEDGNLEEFGWLTCPFCGTTVSDGNRCDRCGGERDTESGDWEESSDK
jgi:hypothetical protein